MGKKVSYMSLLKEAVNTNESGQGVDTTDSVDLKGPFLDPIIGWDGGGELPTHKDASSILERYYFKRDSDSGVEVSEEAKIRQVGGDKGALKDEPEAVTKSKKDIAKAVKQESSEEEGDPIVEGEEGEEGAELSEGEEVLEESEEILEEDEDLIENAVIEKLIAEMEEEDLAEQDFTKDDSGTKPAGKDPETKADNLVPDRKDNTGVEGVEESDDLAEFDDLLNLMEEEEIVPGGEEKPEKDDDDAGEEKEEKEDLDVDKELKEDALGPMGHPHDAESYENLEEFKIFNEMADDEKKDDAPDMTSDDIRV